MTDQPRFCGACGTPVLPAAAFCQSCGQSVSGPAPVAAQRVDFSTPTPPPRRSRRGWVLGAVLVVLVLVGGGLAAATLLGGDEAALAGGGRLPSAVGSEPEEAWTYDADEYPSVSVSGDTTILSLGESGDIVALDSDGEEMWSTRADRYGYGYAASGDRDLVVVQGYEDYGLGVLSIDDGEELWFDDEGGSAQGFTDDGLFVSTYDEDDSDSVLALVDPETGEARWSTSGVISSSVTEDAVYVVAGGDLRRLEPGSGDETWSVDLDLDSDDYPSLTATDELVAVSATEVTAYDSADGETLWSEGPDNSESSLYLGAFGPDRIFVNETYYDSEIEESTETVRVFDREGEVGELDNDKDEPFYAVAFRAGGEHYLLNNGDGTLYDGTLERVGSYEGDLTVVDNGIYGLDDDELAYYELGEGSAAWEIDVDSGDSRVVTAGDDVVYVVVDDEVTAYR